jgi:hypothetical protein
VEPNDARDLYFKGNRADPVGMRFLELRFQGADITPGIEVVRVPDSIIVDVDDLGQFLAEESECSLHRDDMDGHVKPIEDQNAGVEGAGPRERTHGGVVPPRLLTSWVS